MVQDHNDVTDQKAAKQDTIIDIGAKAEMSQDHLDHLNHGPNGPNNRKPLE